MRLYKRKEDEAKLKADLDEANKKYKKIGAEIEKLLEYSALLCPLITIGYSFQQGDIHNHVLYDAIKEKIEKLKKQQKEIEI